LQTNPAVERSKIIRWSENPWNQSGMGKEKVHGGKDLNNARSSTGLYTVHLRFSAV